MSYRVEEKIPMTLSDSDQFLESLKDQGSKLLFPKRIIQSDYFDSNQFILFRESEEGLLPRKKVRIRHYPLSNQIEYSLEIKISSIEGRYKTAKKLSDSQAKRIINTGYFDQIYGLLEKKISVSYSREYFSFQGIRITRDTQISYQDLINKTNNFIEKDSVVEIKAPENTPVDFLLKIIPSQRRRFSKYCNAIKSLNLE
jgi:hypothetical protein